MKSFKFMQTYRSHFEYFISIYKLSQFIAGDLLIASFMYYTNISFFFAACSITSSNTTRVTRLIMSYTEFQYLRQGVNKCNPCKGL